MGLEPQTLGVAPAVCVLLRLTVIVFREERDGLRRLINPVGAQEVLGGLYVCKDNIIYAS